MKDGFRKKNGKLEYRFYHQGKRHSVVGSTEKECKAKAGKLILEASKGLKQDAKSITWAEYVQEWLKVKEVTVKQSSYFSYQKKLKMLSDLDTKKMVDIDRRDILALQSKLAKKYSTSTTNWLITTVRHIFDEAIADYIIERNPAMKIKALKRKEPKAIETIHRAFTRDEQEKFFAYARKRNAWYLELCEFMLVTGVRVGEAGALRWKDVVDSIHIDKTIAQVGNSEFVVQSTKTEAGKRNLPLTAAAKDILARQKIKVAEHKGVQFIAPDQLVFYSFSDESCINPKKVDSAIECFCKGAKIDKRSSHALRDTYATRCIQQGMQPNTLKTLMGHTKISMTMDLYAQVQPEDMKEAMAKVNIL